ncbi:sensor histidine kinase (plasmid) [Streptoverticillium reticulum]|uniref:sensor histidine kinase n=1 Tax=Streptoverticillium reticulum TaxID=1433415 RepID=UPI0039BEED8B
MTPAWVRRHATVRARLTALYAVMLLLGGTGLIALVCILVRRLLPLKLKVATVQPLPSDAPARPSPIPGTPAKAVPDALIQHLGDTALTQVVFASLLALAVFAVFSVALAWWLSGRALRPVATITATARRLSTNNLNERISLQGPADELKELADTFDAMLDRLAAQVDSQRRFVANAAHELRTPLAIQRFAADVGLANSGSAQVEQTRDRLLSIADRSERLIDALLLLSVSDQGLQHTEDVELAALVTAVITESRDAAEQAGITLTTHLEPVQLHGDPVLLTHLIRNVISNAIRHNTADGRVEVRLTPQALEVSNTGPHIADKEIPRLFEPFQRTQARRTSPDEGTGLGLSIAASIARAHHCGITAHPNPEGGLTLRLTFEPAG